jgi:hypothetical protein
MVSRSGRESLIPRAVRVIDVDRCGGENSFIA